MRNIGIALISAVLVLGGCGSDKYDYNKIADAIKAKGYTCDVLEFFHLVNNKIMIPFKEDILKMNRSEYEKLVKAMNCNLEELSVETQLASAKEGNNYRREDIIEHIEKMGK